MSNAPAPAAPAFEPMPLARAIGYGAASIVIGLTQGVAQGFISTNIPQIAGDLGATTTQASWLMAAFLIPRATMPILLMKLRAQFGLRRFAELATVLYLVVALVSFSAFDLRSAIAVQFFAGMASAPLSTLAFLYMLEPLPPAWKMRLGLPLSLAAISVGPHLARVISPALMGDAGWSGLHMMTLGMAAICLALVYLLPLKSPPREKAIAPLDLVSWALISLGSGGIIVGLVIGPIRWWTEVAWLGWLQAASIACLALAGMIELNRKKPLVDIRWLMSPAMLHLTVTLLVFRLILSEQSSGAPRMFQALGVTQGQLVPLFAVISAATVLGALVLIPVLTPKRVPQFHLVALILIAAGAYMDSNSTIDTRPAQMMLSQAMIAFAGSLFMAPAMMLGLMAAFARGPAYLLNFVIIFISTQSIGGAAGSGLFSTFINQRQAAHLQMLREDLATTDPAVMQQVGARALGYIQQVPDATLGRAQAVATIAQDASNQAYVMAYNDAYFLTFLVAAGALVALLLHLWRDWLAARWPRPLPASTAESAT